MTDEKEVLVEDGSGEIEEAGESNKTSMEEENKKLKETVLRTLAELENTRRIASEEREKTTKYAISKFATDLISVMENFYLAFEHMDEQEVKDKNFYDGIKLTQSELKKVFDKHGMVRIYPINEKFNPELHNAITQVDSEQDENTVVQVMQAGYTLNGRVLRPALVGVSKAKGETE